MNIVFCGVKHCGKSSLGKLLADDLNYKHFDLDDLIEEYFALNNKRQKTVREIFEQYGAEYFFALESKTFAEFLDKQQTTIPDFCTKKLTEISTQKKIQFSIISLGGGTAHNKDVIDSLKRFGLIVYLNVDEKVLLERIIKNGIPPFLRKDSIENDFHKLYLERSVVYKNIADLTIDLQDQSLEKNKRLIKKTIEEHSNAGKYIW